MSGEMGGSWSEVHQGLGRDRMQRSILHVTPLEAVRWDCSCFLKCPVFFCIFQNGGSFCTFVPWKCSSSVITVQPSRVKFLIWIPKQQNLLFLSWFWWKCVNLSLFNPSDKSPFSFVFHIHRGWDHYLDWLLVTLSPWLWVPPMTLQVVRRPVVSSFFLPIEGEVAICPRFLCLVPCWFLCKAGWWVIPHLAAWLPCGRGHFNPGKCTLVFTNPKSAEMKGYFSLSSTGCNQSLNRIYLLQADLPTSCCGEQMKEMGAPCYPGTRVRDIE